MKNGTRQDPPCLPRRRSERRRRRRVAAQRLPLERHAHARRRAAHLRADPARGQRAFGEHGAAAEDFIVSHGAQTAVGHELGSGPIAADDVVLFDLFPRDRESACYSDFTRTFLLGPPSDELAEYHQLAKEALDLASRDVVQGVRAATSSAGS